jgi:hypothetical protein
MPKPLFRPNTGTAFRLVARSVSGRALELQLLSLFPFCKSAGIGPPRARRNDHRPIPKPGLDVLAPDQDPRFGSARSAQLTSLDGLANGAATEVIALLKCGKVEHFVVDSAPCLYREGSLERDDRGASRREGRFQRRPGPRMSLSRHD